MKNLDWMTKLGFFVVLIVALGISWWSLYTLALNFSLPAVLAVGVSFAFDGAALFLAGMTSKYARMGDNALLAKIGTYFVIIVSVILNVFHAKNLAFGALGMIMFGMSSVVAAIVFEVYLRFIHRQALKEKGRVLDKLPITGKLAFLFYFGTALRVHKLALRKRLHDAAVTVSDFDSDHPIFFQGHEKTPPIIATAQRQDRPQEQALTASQSPTVAELVRQLMGEGISDKKAIQEQIEQSLGRVVPMGTINKTIQRIKDNK